MSRLRYIGGGAVFIDLPTAPPGVEDDQSDDYVPCCMASAMRGPLHCTCWQPVFDLEQTRELAHGPMPCASKCCHDCAYRNGSPERSNDFDAEHLQAAARGAGIFVCHQGMRRAIEYRHPDGRVLPAGDGDYQPPERGAMSWRADGQPATVCAGWAAHRS